MEQKYDSYSFDRDIRRNKELFKVKSGIIWGIKKNKYIPILYISKPKGIGENNFQKMLDKLVLYFSK